MANVDVTGSPEASPVRGRSRLSLKDVGSISATTMATVMIGGTCATTWAFGFMTEGWDAEVVVSQEQLDLMCDASIALVRWLAKELVCAGSGRE